MRVLLSQFVCEAASYLPSNCFMRGSVGGISWYIGACQCIEEVLLGQLLV